jgi:hypothetical protein
MTRRRWWRVGILMMVGAVGGCWDGDHHHHHHGCLFVREVEPNDTVHTTQFLDDIFVGDCIVVTGNLFDAADVDRYSVLIRERLTLRVTLDHSSQVDFALQLLDADTGQLIRDCGSGVVPEVCVVPFVGRSRDIAVDIVVTSVSGAGPYTLTLDAQ